MSDLYFEILQDFLDLRLDESRHLIERFLALDNQGRIFITQECVFLMYLCIRLSYTAAAAWLTAALGLAQVIIIAACNGYFGLAKSDHKRGGITFEAAKANNFQGQYDVDSAYI